MFCWWILRVVCTLTGHGIDHKQRFYRINCGMNLFDFVHHRFVNVQTTRSIHQQQVGVDFCPSDLSQKPVDIVNNALREARLKFYDAAGR
jgi:hypothetical protein